MALPGLYVGVSAAVAVCSVGVVALKYFYFAGGVCTSKARLDGKTVVITGGNTGIGKETALDLAGRGARVILACRDLAKAENAASQIRETSGNGNVLVKKLDLASLKSIRSFADEILGEESRLDILINNAGIMQCPHWKTEDGFEMQFGVNHLGHFLLTNLLIDLLKKSAPSRIVNVSSLSHRWGKINFDDLTGDKNYNARVAYSQSKLANVLFTRELSKRLMATGVTANSLHPGVVKTELGRHMSFNKSLLKNFFYIPLFWVVFKTPTQGAQTTIHCAVAEELEKISGRYFSDCAEKEPAEQAKDDGVAKQLWEVSAALVGLEKTV